VNQIDTCVCVHVSGVDGELIFLTLRGERLATAEHVADVIYEATADGSDQLLARPLARADAHGSAAARAPKCWSAAAVLRGGRPNAKRVGATH
jgi:hypothetical protein